MLREPIQRIYIFNTDVGRECVQDCKLAADFFGKHDPVLVSLVVRRNKKMRSPVPSPSINVVEADRGERNAERFPRLKYAERHVHTAFYQNRARVFAPSPSSARGVEARIVVKFFGRGKRILEPRGRGSSHRERRSGRAFKMDAVRAHGVADARDARGAPCAARWSCESPRKLQNLQLLPAPL